MPQPDPLALLASLGTVRDQARAIGTGKSQVANWHQDGRVKSGPARLLLELACELPEVERRLRERATSAAPRP